MGDPKEKFCSREVKKRKSSEQTKLSPRQRRFLAGVIEGVNGGGSLENVWLPYLHSPEICACSFT